MKHIHVFRTHFIYLYVSMHDNFLTKFQNCIACDIYKYIDQELKMKNVSVNTWIYAQYNPAALQYLINNYI